MDTIRNWLSSLSSRSTSAIKAKPQNLDRAAGQTRADHVTELQAHVSRLQQEILALSNAAEGRTDGDARGGSNAQMVALERELDEALRELAKYQGRI